MLWECTPVHLQRLPRYSFEMDKEHDHGAILRLLTVWAQKSSRVTQVFLWGTIRWWLAKTFCTYTPILKSHTDLQLPTYEQLYQCILGTAHLFPLTAWFFF
jgi:hypothetical protein